MKDSSPIKKHENRADTVLIAASGRSGQTWLGFMLAHLLNARFIEPYCLARGIVFTGHRYVLELTQGSLPGRLPTPYQLVVKTHEHPDPYFSLSRKVLLIVRDPRDAITSASVRYHVMKTTGSDIEEDAQEMALVTERLPKQITLKDRIWSLIYGNRTLAIWMSARKWRNFHVAWRRLPFVHIVRYEDLLQRPLEAMQAICSYLAIPDDEHAIEETLRALSFKEITGRSAGSEKAESIMFRKAIVGDHKKKLSTFELALIRMFCKEEATRLGYTI